MENEKQLIEIISQKEGELRVGSETVIREAEQIVSRSRTEAARLIQMAEEEGKAAADDEYARQMQILDGDISWRRSEEKELPVFPRWPKRSSPLSSGDLCSRRWRISLLSARGRTIPL